jgi:hypothetical protein
VSLQTWQETLITAQSAGTAVTGTSVGSLLPAQAKYTLPTNYLDNVGKTLRIRAMGQSSNIVTTPGTLQFAVKAGSTVINTGPAWQLVTTAKTNVTWVLDLVMYLRANGATANFLAIGNITGESFQSGAGTANYAGTQSWPLSAPAVGSNFDATVSQQIDLTAQFSLTGNSVQLMGYTLEALN